MSQIDDSDLFFDVLAGNKQGDAIASAFRKALLDERNTIAEAERLYAADGSEDETQSLDDIKKMLMDSGVFKHAQVADKSGGLRLVHSKPHTVQKFFQSTKFLALAASVACIAIAIGLVNLAHEPDYSALSSSSVSATIVQLPEPEKTAGLMQQALQSAGAKVTLNKVSATEWALHIDVPPSADPQQVEFVLRSIGLSDVHQSRYDLSLRASQ